MATPGNGTCLAQSLHSDRSHRHPLATRAQGYATESVRQGLLDRIPLLRRMPALPHAGPAFGGAAPATDLLTPERPDTPSPAAARPRARGKFLFVGNEKLYVRGVTYGTFRPRADGTEVPEPAVVERDFALMSANGINAIRTYSVPPRWLPDAAQRHNLRGVEQPARRHAIGADGVDPVRRHEREVPLHDRGLGDLSAVGAGAEGAVGHAPDVELFVPDEEELAPRARPRRCRGRCVRALRSEEVCRGRDTAKRRASVWNRRHATQEWNAIQESLSHRFRRLTRAGPKVVFAASG